MIQCCGQLVISVFSITYFGNVLAVHSPQSNIFTSFLFFPSEALWISARCWTAIFHSSVLPCCVVFTHRDWDTSCHLRVKLSLGGLHDIPPLDFREIHQLAIAQKNLKGGKLFLGVQSLQVLWIWKDGSVSPGKRSHWPSQIHTLFFSPSISHLRQEGAGQAELGDGQQPAKCLQLHGQPPNIITFGWNTINPPTST